RLTTTHRLLNASKKDGALCQRAGLGLGAEATAAVASAAAPGAAAVAAPVAVVEVAAAGCTAVWGAGAAPSHRRAACPGGAALRTALPASSAPAPFRRRRSQCRGC